MLDQLCMLWKLRGLVAQLKAQFNQLNNGGSMAKMLDSVVPFFVGHRTELTVVLTALLNLLNAVAPKTAPLVATVTGIVNTVAPYAAAMFAAARATRATAP